MSNLQDNFLNQARKEKVHVTIHLTNGFQIKGTIRSFDQFTILVESLKQQHLIFKHTISTIIPSKTLDISKQIEEASNYQKMSNVCK